MTDICLMAPDKYKIYLDYSGIEFGKSMAGSLYFLEHELFKEEINIENSSKYDALFSDVLRTHGLPDPHEGNIQYVRIFLSIIPLPKGKELTDEEFGHVCNQVLRLLGISCDGEINRFMSELDELIVDSVYKLELRRLRKSMMRDHMYNVDMAKCQKRLMKKTTLGMKQENIFHLVMVTVYQIKGIDLSGMTDEEYGKFVRETDPEAYQEMQEKLQAFKENLEKMAGEKGIKIFSKKDLGKYFEQYGIPFRDILEGGDIQKVDDLAECDHTDSIS